MDLPPSLFLVLLLCTLPNLALAASMPHSNYTDLESLLAFKSSVADPLGILSTNWTTNTSFCSWIGVTCGRRHPNRVTSLSFYDIPLQGTISPHLANLSFLSDLTLSNATLSGPIPTTLTRLTRLRTLTLQINTLSGPVPSSLFNITSLNRIYLGYNYHLSGPLPSNITASLQVLVLSYNQFTGHIPSTFARCPNLTQLSLSYNNLSGSIPAELGGLPELSILYLASNQLTGNIPSSLGNLTNLNLLEIGSNNLEGEIPEELGQLSLLENLMLGFNGLTGSIPTALSNLSTIQIVDLNDNSLTGSVPSTIGKSMPLIYRFNVAGNSLTGGLSFVDSLSSCNELTILLLASNELDGALPDSVGNLSANLQYFMLGENRVTGSIPASFGNLGGLLRLDLHGNELTGAIPRALGRLRTLQDLYLDDNRINGSIPSEIGEMKSLGRLHLIGNIISGAIPDSVGNLTGLQNLRLALNNLSSTVPLSLWNLTSLVDVNLSRNALHGSIPMQAGNLIKLNSLDLSENRFSGNISSALGDLQMLTYLGLSDNSFHGEIPRSFGRLINVQHLNLSGNFLSGGIPDSIANLSYLVSLDLSFNMLEGQIPKGGVFMNLTLPSLEGNKALCDAPRLGFPSCYVGAANNSHSRRKSHVVEFILPAIALMVVLTTLCLIFIIRRRRRKAKTLICTDTLQLGDHRVVSRHELVRATDNFSQANLLGRGSFGSVFKGLLNDGLVVAVKVLNLDIDGASKSFDVECQALCNVRHKNLIKIISVCTNLDFKALILQYMPNGSLEQWLYSQNSFLNLAQRLNVMVDVSIALEYLHHHHPEVVLHCDLKPANILLDENMVAHVSDFGIAKLLLNGSKSIASASALGTIGYIAPEYGSTSKVSRMGDVYSFGILLLETFVGKRPTDATFNGELSFREYICKAYPAKLLDIINVNLLRDDSLSSEQQLDSHASIYQCLSSIIELGLLCSSYIPKERILMTDVVPRLQKIKGAYSPKLSSS